MGNLQAAEYAELDDRKAALIAHLTSNHFPPIPAECWEAADKAIELVAESEVTGIEDTGQRVDLPSGVTYKGVDAAPAWAIVEGWHLDAFVEVELLRAQGVEGDEVE